MSSHVNIIKFYKAEDENGFMCNYFLSPIIINGEKFATVEHYYQSSKFKLDSKNNDRTTFKNYEEFRQIIININTPNKARELANMEIKGGYKWRTDLNLIIQKYSLAAEAKDLNVKKIENWEQIKDIIMEIGLYAKFTQNGDLKKKLLSTDDSLLIEDSPRDSYWGIGKDGNGENKLGILLTKVRNNLISQSL
jgi:ribA/ribD-fused uncharacterized protein